MAIVLGWLLVVTTTGSATALQNADVLKLQAVAIQRAGGEDLLLRIVNVSSAPVAICVRTTSLRLNDVGVGEGMSHRCQAAASFDLILAGESAFRRPPVMDSSGVSDRIATSVTVVMDSVFGGKEQVVTLSWNGTGRQARQNGAQILRSSRR